MRGVFDDRELEQAEARHDTELTLGSTTLLLIFFGLVLLCGLCFGLGYATGHHGTADTVTAAPPAAGQSATAPDSDRPKPAPEQQTASSEPAPSDAGDQSSTSPAPAGGLPAATAEAVPAPSGVPVVKPAFASAATPVQGGEPAGAAVAPAMPAAGTVMVQIAAISQQEDADVLMSALRKRGYAVAGHREPLDGLIHVRVGPFKTRDEAETWRQKLLNDGYNAIVQP